MSNVIPMTDRGYTPRDTPEPEQLNLSPDVPRDRWQRPLIIPLEGGTPKPYTRCTTLAGALDDQWNLTAWKLRMTVLGLTERADLIMGAAGLGPEPDRDREEHAWRKWRTGLDQAADAAMEAAKSSAAATVGTALHSFTERLDRGQPLGNVPESFVPHLKAYEATVRELGMEPVFIEQFVVNDEFKVAGTADRFARIGGRLYTVDVKSGSTEFGVGKMCVQLAVYAHGERYTPDTGLREPVGDVETDAGLIIALNARRGTCEPKWIDIAAGWESVQLAVDVRKWRSRREWTIETPVHPGPDPDVQVGDPLDAALLNAIRKATDPGQLYTLWQSAGARWQPHHTEAAQHRKAELIVSKGLNQ